MEHPKILIISSTAWNDNNSFGNTFSNLFSGWNAEKILNIYCDSNLPKTTVCNKFFQMSEKMIVKNILDSDNKTGKIINDENKDNTTYSISNSEKNVLDLIRRSQFQLFKWARDIIWLTDRWKSKELFDYIDEFDPDIIFLPMYTTYYMHYVQQCIVKYANKKYVFYTSDDGCTFKQFSLSPLYWIDRLCKRSMYKKVINQSEHIYVISEKQKYEYQKIFNKECKILFKGSDFTPIDNNTKMIEFPLKLIYTGNIGDGRWKSLSKIGKLLDVINKDGIKMQLHIYTMTPLSGLMKRTLGKHKSIFMMGSAPPSEISKIQRAANILVHVESFNLKEKLKVRLSFSTKLVDYFANNKCILAVGPRDISSIEYLIKNDAAIVASNDIELQLKLQQILENPTVIGEYAKKAWNCGDNNHQIEKIQQNLYNDLFGLIDDV